VSTAALGVAGFGIAVLIAMTLSTAPPSGASTRPGRSTPTVIAGSGGSTAAATEAGPTPASPRTPPGGDNPHLSRHAGARSRR
jgi:hypothetical protein